MYTTTALIAAIIIALFFGLALGAFMTGPDDERGCAGAIALVIVALTTVFVVTRMIYMP